MLWVKFIKVIHKIDILNYVTSTNYELILRLRAYKSLTLIVTFPFVIFLILKPTVGIISSLNCPDCNI